MAIPVRVFVLMVRFLEAINGGAKTGIIWGNSIAFSFGLLLIICIFYMISGVLLVKLREWIGVKKLQKEEFMEKSQSINSMTQV
jgi:hypothetical protein